MKELNIYIIEKLQLNKDTKVVSIDKLDIDSDKLKGKEMQISDSDVDRICELIEKLPIQPESVTNSKNGGIILKYKGKGTFYGTKKLKSEIHITLPDRYDKKCYKITWYTPVDYMPYEYPVGNLYIDKKNNKPKLATIDEVFDQILKHWNDRNMSKIVNKNA